MTPLKKSAWKAILSFTLFIEKDSIYGKNTFISTWQSYVMINISFFIQRQSSQNPRKDNLLAQITGF